MITILSHDEQQKAIVAEARDGFTVTYYRRTANERWAFGHAAFSDYPLHLVLDMAHGVVNAPSKVDGIEKVLRDRNRSDTLRRAENRSDPITKVAFRYIGVSG